ncbi:MAG TPA: hypothetical protein VMD79_02045 [Solirubrobacteraceae bacterium]|nr:hypothetical protein [Solirubrobacteraceae bacterium]
MGRRSRRREQLSAPGGEEQLAAPSSDYEDGAGNVLTLRGSLTAKARREYAHTLAGASGAGARPAATREDSEQRALELLFERLAVRWVIAGAPIARQRELVARFRVASADERAWVRRALREHCAEHFPDVQAP